jgi:hypothetical protein
MSCNDFLSFLIADEIANNIWIITIIELTIETIDILAVSQAVYLIPV